MTELAYKQESPKKIGHYWWRKKGEKGFLVYVYRSFSGALAYRGGSNYVYYVERAENKDAWWCGPLVEPSFND